MDIPRIALIMVVPKMYEVNTVINNPTLELRDSMFGVPTMAGETMIWELDPDDTQVRRNPILHCQRYKTAKAMARGHKAIVNKLVDGDTTFFNGDGFPNKLKEVTQ